MSKKAREATKKKKEEEAKRKAEEEARKNAEPETPPENKSPDNQKKEEEGKKEEPPIEEESKYHHKGMVRVKTQRGLYIPTGKSGLPYSVPKGEIVRVEKKVFDDSGKDLEELEDGPTSKEMIEEESKKK